MSKLIKFFDIIYRHYDAGSKNDTPRLLFTRLDKNKHKHDNYKDYSEVERKLIYK